MRHDTMGISNEAREVLSTITADPAVSGTPEPVGAIIRALESGEALAALGIGDQGAVEELHAWAREHVWAARVEIVDGGVSCWESVADYETWTRQG